MSDPKYTSGFRKLLLTAAGYAGGGNVVSNLAELARTEAFSREELKEYQFVKLKRLVEHVYKNVPYYRKHMKSKGLTPADFRDLGDITGLPIITKKEIRDNQMDLRAIGSDRPMKIVEFQTGGTTGEPLEFVRNAECVSFSRAAILRSYTWTGYRIGDPILVLTGGALMASPLNFKQRVGFTLMNFHFLPAFQLRRDTLSEYINVVRKNKIRYIRGYSTVIYEFAALCESEGITDIEFSAAYPTAEMITPAQADTIRRAFRCEIFDQYGCAEVNALTHQCTEGRRHVIEEHVIIEDIDNALVLTDLDNYAQPFIRYSNGDRGRISGEPCPCGRNLTVLEEFLGRDSDFVYMRSGDRLAGVFFHHLMGNFAGVAQFQLIQDRRDELLLRIVRNSEYTPDDELQLKRLILEHSGIEPVIEYRDAIERTGTGKITSVIRNID